MDALKRTLILGLAALAVSAANIRRSAEAANILSNGGVKEGAADWDPDSEHELLKAPQRHTRATRA